MNKQKLNKIKEDLSLFFYNKYNFGIEKLKVLQEIIDILGGLNNEKDFFINYNS